MAIGALRRSVGAYGETWLAAGPAGRRFLTGTLVYATRLGGVGFALPLFLQARGYDRGAIGQVLAASSIALLVLGFPVVRAGARIRHRHLLALGPVLSALGLLIIALAPPGALWPTTFGAFLAGTGGATFWTLGDPLLAATTPVAWRTHAFALKFLASVIGYAIGGALGGWLPSLIATPGGGIAAGLGATLVVMALLDLAQAVTFWTLPAIAVAPSGRVAGQRAPLWRLAVLVVPEAGFAAGFGAIKAYLPLFLTDGQDLPTSLASTTLALAAIAGGLGVVALPGIGGRVGLLPVIAGCRFAGAVVVVTWFAGFGPLAVAALVCLYWLLVDGTQGLYVASAMERVPVVSRAQLSAAYAMFWSVGSTGANYLSGQLQETALGFVAAFAVGIAGYVLSSVWIATVFPLLPRVGATGSGEAVPDEAAVGGGEPLARAESG